MFINTRIRPFIFLVHNSVDVLMTYDRIHEWWRAVRKGRFIADSKAVCSGYLGRLGRGDKSDLVQCFCNWIISDIDRVTLNGTKHLLLVLLSLPVRDSSDSSLCGCSLCVHLCNQVYTHRRARRWCRFPSSVTTLSLDHASHWPWSPTQVFSPTGSTTVEPPSQP